MGLVILGSVIILVLFFLGFFSALVSSQSNQYYQNSPFSTPFSFVIA